MHRVIHVPTMTNNTKKQGDEMRNLLVATLVLVSAQNVNAKESTEGLNINNPKDALSLISADKLGAISLESFINDIRNDIVYSEKTKYSTGYIAIQSQNDYGHYGDVDFEFKPPFSITKEDVISQAKNIKNVKITDKGTRVYLRWESNDFKCSLDFDSDQKYPLFQYLCHYSEK